MTDSAPYAAAFASPLGGCSDEFVRRVALARLERGRRIISRALRDLGEAEAAAALVSFVPGSESVWRPELGLSLLAYRNRSVTAAALQLSLALAGSGGKGSIHVPVDSPLPVYLDGWVGIVEGACSLVADGHSIFIASDRGRSVYRASRQGWVPEAGSAEAWRSHPSGARAPRYVIATNFRGAVDRYPWLSVDLQDTSNAASITPLGITTIRKAWELIAEKSPIYSSWVMSTAAGCALLLPSSRGHQSASSSDYPGLIAIEPPSCAVFCAEMLVHECSHQQLLAYAALAPLVSPGSDQTVYSPIKCAYRPLLNVLFGGHAVGNILLYYCALGRSMALDDDSAGRFRAHRAWFEESYRTPLEKSPWLTNAGRRLWTALCDVVDAQLEQ